MVNVVVVVAAVISNHRLAVARLIHAPILRVGHLPDPFSFSGKVWMNQLGTKIIYDSALQPSGAPVRGFQCCRIPETSSRVVYLFQ